MEILNLFGLLIFVVFIIYMFMMLGKKVEIPKQEVKIGQEGIVNYKMDDGRYYGIIPSERDMRIVVSSDDSMTTGDKFIITEFTEKGIIAKKI